VRQPTRATSAADVEHLAHVVLDDAVRVVVRHVYQAFADDLATDGPVRVGVRVFDLDSAAVDANALAALDPEGAVDGAAPEVQRNRSEIFKHLLTGEFLSRVRARRPRSST
jgi:hypothetical protein